MVPDWTNNGHDLTALAGGSLSATAWTHGRTGTIAAGNQAFSSSSMPNLVTSHTVAGWFSIANVNSGSFYLFSDNYNGVGSGLEIRGAGGDFKFWITGKDTQDLVINSSLPLQND